ncbi:MAG TPA: serine hydrolase [Candidimonas sp.]|nr:serine hydrolase [Candidimonas sp.]
MKRRTLLQIAALGTLSTAAIPASQGQTPNVAEIEKALKNLGTLSPGQTAACVSVQGKRLNKRLTLNAEQALFVGSSVKTFILAQYLKDTEAGRLSTNTQVQIGPESWSPGSPVFINLTGSTTANSALEAMIAHSDNTATDIALKAAGADNVRKLIKDAGLNQTRIPDSTRVLFSYLAGAPEGTDLGWAGMEKMQAGEIQGQPRAAINSQQTMVSTADEMTQWYEQVLAGKHFQKPETLAQFKRISAMADAMPVMVPEDTVAYGKGGSIDWNGFHCFCVAGQMVLPSQNVSFCFIVNWEGDDTTVPTVFASFKDQVRQILHLAAGK